MQKNKKIYKTNQTETRTMSLPEWYFGTISITWSLLRPFDETSYDHLGVFGTILDQIGLLMIVWYHLRSFKAIWDNI